MSATLSPAAPTAYVPASAHTTFAMLFGIGFAVQLSRADARGENLVPRYLRVWRSITYWRPARMRRVARIDASQLALN